MEDTQRNQVKDYVVLMLGAPVVKVELDEQQLDLVLDMAIEGTMNSIHRPNIVLIKMGSLALAKIMLGRIRGKYNKVPGPGGSILLDGVTLTKEGNKDLEEWKNSLQECANVCSRFGL